MTDITIGALPREASEQAPQAARKGFFRTLYEALIEARRLQAEAMLKDYRRHGKPIW